MTGVSNAHIAQQLGEVQGSLKHLVREGENARGDRLRIFERLERQEAATAMAAAAAAEAAAAAARVAETASTSLQHIEEMQKELVESVNPAIADYLENKPHIEGYKNLKTKAAGVVLALLFIGWGVMEVLKLFASEIKRWLWGH